MAISVFDLFKIGIGPSSSHTVGPMRAAHKFVTRLDKQGLLLRVGSLRIELFGSLGATGIGHGTDRAILLGLEGEEPATVDTQGLDQRMAALRQSGQLSLLGKHGIAFDQAADLLFKPRKILPYHPNGMCFSALDGDGQIVDRQIYYSIGGGFVVQEADAQDDRLRAEDSTQLPYSFHSMDELLQHCERSGMSISRIMLENEKCWRSEIDIRSGLLNIWQVMKDCIKAGYRNEGVLPGGLKVKRRAPALYAKLRDQPEAALRDPLTTMDWVNL